MAALRPRRPNRPVRIRAGYAYLVVLVPGLLVVDLLNGALGEGQPVPYVGLSPGELVRGVLLIYGLTVCLRRSGTLYQSARLWAVGLTALGLVTAVLLLVRGGSMGDFLVDAEAISKAVYAPVLVVLFIDIIRRYRVRQDEVLRALALVGPVAGAALMLAALAGVGYATYGSYATAFRGLFLAQNDLGLAMVLSLFVSTHLVVSRRRLRDFVAVAVTIGGMLVLGTRVATLGAFAVPALVLLIEARARLNWRNVPLVATLALLVAGALAAVGVLQYRRTVSQGFQAARYRSVLQGGLTRAFLLSGAIQHVRHRPLVEDLTGEGTASYERGVARALHLSQPSRPAEVDWMDLFGGQGLLFMLALYGFYVSGFFPLHRLDVLGDAASRTVPELMLGVFLLHASLAGHAMSNPIPGAVIALVLAYGHTVATLRESLEPVQLRRRFVALGPS